MKKVFLQISQNSQETTCARVSLFLTLAYVFSSEFCAISKNTFFLIKHFWWLLLKLGKGVLFSQINVTTAGQILLWSKMFKLGKHPNCRQRFIPTHYPEGNVMLFTVRCSRRRFSFLKKVVLKDFANATGKHMCWSHFLDKVAGLQDSNSIKGVFL